MCLLLYCDLITVTSESKEMISWMRGHSKTVHTISVHESGTLAISSSEDTAQLWDLENFERKRKLTVASETPIQKVCSLGLFKIVYSERPLIISNA